MTKNAALHWARQGIRVNSVYPGFVDAPMLEQAKEDQQVMDAIVAMTPMGRLGRPEEVAALVTFLASDEADAELAQRALEACLVSAEMRAQVEAWREAGR
jgi:NAD(P)-dependent dehydrogenase (short-subunit alcohol dehydrogenase family)